MIKMPGRALTRAAAFAVLLGLLGSTGSHKNGRERQVQPERFDIFIRGGSVVDGTGSAARQADILVRGDRIVAIGNIDPASVEAGRVINAGGMAVTPGFIDAHSHGDPFSTPDFRSFLAMGVTTITLGQDGSSPGRDDIPGWMERVDRLDLGTNIVLFVGHATVRRLAGVGMDEPPTPEQLHDMASIVENAMAAGCFGLSTGLEYRPGYFADMEELVAIAEPVAEAGGMVMSHIRSEDNDVIEESLNELFAQGEGSGCAVHVSHIKVVYGHGSERAEQVLALMQECREKGIRITADIYPYNASYTGISIVFPGWALPPNDYSEVVENRRGELADYLRSRVAMRNGPEATLFATEPWRGRTLALVAHDLGKPYEDVLIDDIGPGGASAAYFVMDSQLQERLLIDPHVMISTDGSPSMHHPRGYGAFARIIREYVVERGVLSLEQAVHKMSGLTASTLGLEVQKRGILAPGFAADILIFDPERVRDTATFTEPNLLATGFDWVIVNGTVVCEEGIFTGDYSGIVLRK